VVRSLAPTVRRVRAQPEVRNRRVRNRRAVRAGAASHCATRSGAPVRSRVRRVAQPAARSPVGDARRVRAQRVAVPACAVCCGAAAVVRNRARPGVPVAVPHPVRRAVRSRPVDARLAGHCATRSVAGPARRRGVTGRRPPAGRQARSRRTGVAGCRRWRPRRSGSRPGIRRVRLRSRTGGSRPQRNRPRRLPRRRNRNQTSPARARRRSLPAGPHRFAALRRHRLRRDQSPPEPSRLTRRPHRPTRYRGATS
jgi:hypothetical protein